MDKLRSTLKQFVRDWSEEGKEEREMSYGPMKEALLSHFSDIPQEERKNFRVLVPGAGLGRLAYDVASLGFACQGNEFSHYMLLASFLILNKTERPNMHTIYPYVHTFSNLPDRSSMLRAVTIPDVMPTLPPGSAFSLVAGDFEEIYNGESDPNEPQAGLWDAILTCFFIDTAKNIVNYLRIIHNILAPGGVWINLGPLLWHWENNNTNDPSVELDLAEVKELARMVGFQIENERTIDATYTTNSNGMLVYTYRTAFWTARKKILS
ncbi:N2227-like protein [Rhodocollybia butyracea]|uniref:carnosine N-methyltransferase n=1 Tax=Rhodocollybia butyracea TaxID=206335 RepID=A0A9P5QBZ2_9AGAR|nr:N2227-like protein [Rhodocollybia butyracea]